MHQRCGLHIFFIFDKFSTGMECTTTRIAMAPNSITLLSSSDGAISTESTSGSSAIHGDPIGGKTVISLSNEASTNAKSKPILPTF